MRFFQNLILFCSLLMLLGYTSASPTSDDTYSQDFYNCEQFAAQFPNTCGPRNDVRSQLDFQDVPLADHICYNIEEGKCSGVNIDGACVLKRQLCVMCFLETDGGVGGVQKTKLRVQTNTVPNHCYQLEQQMFIQVKLVDFTVEWLPPVNESAIELNTTRLLNKKLCDVNAAADSNIPEISGYVNNGDLLDEVWGVSTSGAVFTTAVSEDSVDPFYPAPYGYYVRDATLLKKNVDWCLSSANLNKVYHYKVPGTCLVNPQEYEVLDLPQTGNITDLIKEAWLDTPFRTTIGIAKDGRPILSPYRNNGQLYDPCEVDICNGVEVDGHYMYATTTFHPYVMGCYGKGNSPALYQECSANPRLCGVEYRGVLEGDEKTQRTPPKTTGSVGGAKLNWVIASISAILFIIQTTF